MYGKSFSQRCYRVCWEEDCAPSFGGRARNLCLVSCERNPTFYRRKAQSSLHLGRLKRSLYIRKNSCRCPSSLLPCSLNGRNCHGFIQCRIGSCQTFCQRSTKDKGPADHILR